MSNLLHYKFLRNPIIHALEQIRDTDFSKLEDRTYEVEGRDLFFFIQSYETKTVNDTPEAHRQYIDIQYIICGKEQIGIAQLDTAEEIEARPQNDIWFYRCPMDFITVSEGMFAVFFPMTPTRHAYLHPSNPIRFANAFLKCGSDSFPEFWSKLRRQIQRPDPDPEKHAAIKKAAIEMAACACRKTMSFRASAHTTAR